MKSFNSVSLISDPKNRSCLCSLFITMSLIFGVYFIGSACLKKDSFRLSLVFGRNTTEHHIDSDKCEAKCRLAGTEVLPKGIVSSTSNLEMLPLWGPVTEEVCSVTLPFSVSNALMDNFCAILGMVAYFLDVDETRMTESKHATNLLAIAVGINQKMLVNEIVKKFLENDFVVMLFHYDGVVDKWRDLEWSERVVHISAKNQTKWWFAKRFLHPDIVAEYEYIFLWDEDLGVEHFHPQRFELRLAPRYLSIVKEEGLEISQPALDPSKSEVHHHITVRRRRSKVHSWVEMMAPVFSRAAWRCAWYMIQGDRTVKVGVVDEEYIVHLGLPTLGGILFKNKTDNGLSDQSSHSKNLSYPESLAGDMYKFDNRSAVRIRSHDEMLIFRNRWKKAVKEDKYDANPGVGNLDSSPSPPSIPIPISSTTTTTTTMTLCRLLLRSFRRYSSSTSNPYPFHSPVPTPNHHPADPQYPNPNAAAPNQFSSANAAADASTYHHNPQFSTAANFTPNYHASQFSATNTTSTAAAADASNYQHNPQFPTAGNYTPNYQNTPFSSTSAAADSSNYQQNHQFQAAANFTPNYYNSNATSSAAANASNYHHNPQFSAAPNVTPNYQNPQFSTSNTAAGSPTPFVSQRSYGFSSTEEAAAERRRRKRRLRIEPPLYALRPNPQSPPSNANNPDKPRLPDSTSALVGLRLNLHNRVQSLIRAGDLDSASYTARQSVFQPIRPTVFTCNAIIAAMYRAKRYNDAKALFQYFFRQFNIIPNIVSYNNLIVSHCESNEIEDALKAYEYILENAPYSPSAVTYRHLTKGLIDAGRMNDAVNLLREMLHKGHGADSLVYNNVILGFLNLGNLDKANELFDELKERCTVYDGVVNATFMDWFFNQGKPKEAMESYRDLMSRNYRMVPATRNVLLETLLKHGKKKEAWDLFHDMLDDHTPPTFQAVNSDTFNMMINECFKEGKIEEAMDVFKRAGKGVKSKPFQMDVAGFNNMMTRLCELDMMEEAEIYYKQLCDKSLSPDVNTYRTLIDAYIKMDNVDNMMEKYSKMVEVGLRVIPPYANKWFGFLIEKGKASDCLPILSKMVDKEPKPDVTTYDIVIRGLVEEGNYDATTNLLREMMNHGIGTTVSLKEFVLDVFERQGRRVEIENILNRFSSRFPPQRSNYGGSWGPPRISNEGGRNTTMPWQTASSPQTSYANQFTGQTHQPQMMTEHMARPHPVQEQEQEFPRMAAQNAS
ncbi:hypothetical protein BUALT_Bualt19G0084400 [Buddleja alternifolia]|uniref:Pentatricopeptide repeat-containing protein n=1 Tax=Buddleja alternifolia TaxID=168488 RepID=A0AAV6W835_9LAMI|nr:hypothetical protein BUALT_Bualt19G0084400 [Buddleja alternifolia]